MNPVLSYNRQRGVIRYLNYDGELVVTRGEFSVSENFRRGCVISWDKKTGRGSVICKEGDVLSFVADLLGELLA